MLSVCLRDLLLSGVLQPPVTHTDHWAVHFIQMGGKGHTNQRSMQISHHREVRSYHFRKQHEHGSMDHH